MRMLWMTFVGMKPSAIASHYYMYTFDGTDLYTPMLPPKSDIFELALKIKSIAISNNFPR